MLTRFYMRYRLTIETLIDLMATTPLTDHTTWLLILLWWGLLWLEEK